MFYLVRVDSIHICMALLPSIYSSVNITNKQRNGIYGVYSNGGHYQMKQNDHIEYLKKDIYG